METHRQSHNILVLKIQRLNIQGRIQGGGPGGPDPPLLEKKLDFFNDISVRRDPRATLFGTLVFGGPPPFQIPGSAPDI